MYMRPCSAFCLTYSMKVSLLLFKISVVLLWNSSIGYRRIVVEIDERNIIARKFIERVGFLLEAIMRKHMIIQNRNSNTCLYVILNSEWSEIQNRLKAFLGHPTGPVKMKATAIDVSEIAREIKSKSNETKKLL